MTATDERMTGRTAVPRRRTNPIVKTVRNYLGPILILLILFIILSSNSPNFLTLGNITNILQQVSVYGLLSIGLTYIILIGNVDLSIGSTVAFSGCLSVTLLSVLNLNLYLAIILTLLACMLIGLFNGSCLAYTKLPPFIVTLATQMIVRGLAYIITDGYPVASTSKAFNEIGSGRWTISVHDGLKIQIPYSVAFLFLAFLVFGIVLSKTRFGRYIYAVGGNQEAAIHSGINVRKVRIIVYVIAGALAGCGGIILAARMGSGQPANVGIGYEGEAIAASVLGGVSFGGGIGTIGCTIIGTLIMGVINNGLNMLRFEYFYQLIVKGAIILFSVYFDSVKDQLPEWRTKIFGKKR